MARGNSLIRLEVIGLLTGITPLFANSYLTASAKFSAVCASYNHNVLALAGGLITLGCSVAAVAFVTRLDKQANRLWHWFFVTCLFLLGGYQLYDFAFVSHNLCSLS